MEISFIECRLYTYTSWIALSTARGREVSQQSSEGNTFRLGSTVLQMTHWQRAWGRLAAGAGLVTRLSTGDGIRETTAEAAHGLPESL